jgi:hypothetical protein
MEMLAIKIGHTLLTILRLARKEANTERQQTGSRE